MLHSADAGVHYLAPPVEHWAPQYGGAGAGVTCSTHERLSHFDNHRAGGFLLRTGALMPHRCTLGEDCPGCGQTLDALLAEVDRNAVLVEETGHALEALLLSQLDAIDQVEEALELFAKRHKLVA
jgi:hypothetical protein